MVGVDQPGSHHASIGSHHVVGCRLLAGTSNTHYEAIVNSDPPARDLAAVVIHGYDKVGVGN
jgi:hypothetical protein